MTTQPALTHRQSDFNRRTLVIATVCALLVGVAASLLLKLAVPGADKLPEWLRFIPLVVLLSLAVTLIRQRLAVSIDARGVRLVRTPLLRTGLLEPTSRIVLWEKITSYALEHSVFTGRAVRLRRARGPDIVIFSPSNSGLPVIRSDAARRQSEEFPAFVSSLRAALAEHGIAPDRGSKAQHTRDVRLARLFAFAAWAYAGTRLWDGEIWVGTGFVFVAAILTVRALHIARTPSWT